MQRQKTYWTYIEKFFRAKLTDFEMHHQIFIYSDCFNTIYPVHDLLMSRKSKIPQKIYGFIAIGSDNYLRQFHNFCMNKESDGGSTIIEKIY